MYGSMLRLSVEAKTKVTKKSCLNMMQEATDEAAADVSGFYREII